MLLYEMWSKQCSNQLINIQWCFPLKSILHCSQACHLDPKNHLRRREFCLKSSFNYKQL